MSMSVSHEHEQAAGCRQSAWSEACTACNTEDVCSRSVTLLSLTLNARDRALNASGQWRTKQSISHNDLYLSRRHMAQQLSICYTERMYMVS